MALRPPDYRRFKMPLSKPVTAFPVSTRVAARSMLRPNDHRLPSGALDLEAIKADYRARLGDRFASLGGEALLEVIVDELVEADPFHKIA